MVDILKNTKILDALTMLNTLHEEDAETDKRVFKKFNRGKFSYFLKLGADWEALDVTTDSFSPWNGKDRYGKRQTSDVTRRYVERTTTGFAISKTVTEEQLKVVRNRHAAIKEFRREVETKKKNSFVVPSPKVVRVLPSFSQKCKEALNMRTSRSAKTFLGEIGIQTSMSQLSSMSRSVRNHLKSNVGRKAPTDFYKVMDRFVNKTNPEEHMKHPVIETDEHGKMHVRLMIAYPNAFRCFGKGLPSFEDVSSHRREVNKLLELSEREADNLLKSYLANTNSSGSLPCLGSCVMVDTTFSLCSTEFVTVAIGVNDVFKSSNSSKSASILLAFMIHTSKALEEHEMFAAFLNEMFLEHCQGTCLNLLVHDGELSFKAYNTGAYLKDCITIRCDVHRFSNLKYAVSKDAEDDISCIKERLWGAKKKMPEGQVLKRGILNCFSRTLFEDKMRTLIDDCGSSSAKKWLSDNVSSLYEHNTMFKKLLGGWPAQYLSTNIIESKNAFFKTLITSKKPAQKVLDDFLLLHKEDLDERMKAVAGKPSKYITEFAIATPIWNEKTHTERKALMFSFGLEQAASFNMLESLPPWSLPTKIPEKELMFELANWKLHESVNDPNTFFVVNEKNPSECVRICSLEKKLKCFAYICKNRSGHKLCLHSLKVVLAFDQERRDAVFEEMDDSRNTRTCVSTMREQMRPHHGTKSRRIGTAFSKGNHSRRFLSVVDTTATSLEEDSFWSEEDL